MPQKAVKHKKVKQTSYSIKTKREVVNYEKKHGKTVTANHFNLNVSMVTNSPRKQRTPKAAPKPAVEEVIVSSIEANTEKEKEIYRKVVPVEHVLEITYVPALYKIVDEIFVNAVEQVSEHQKHLGLLGWFVVILRSVFLIANKVRDQEMNVIKVDIDKEGGQISVFNNGKGIPIEIHKDENVYIPQLLFSQLYTSHFNGDLKKVPGGRNGFGAKLTNIY
ncbi:10298_t:CDS:2, partial [Funneliformis geosporum]